MRVVKINGTSCEVSKSEAKRATEIQFMDASKRFRALLEWISEHPDNEGCKTRRRNVGLALGLLQPIRNEESTAQ